MANPNPKKDGLKPFEAGKSGNPKGRPLGTLNRNTIVRKVLSMSATIPDKMWTKLQEYFPDMKRATTVEELMTLAVIYRAIKRSEQGYKNVMDSAYGAPKQEVEHSGEVEIGFDIGKISDEDLKTILTITEKAKVAR